MKKYLTLISSFIIMLCIGSIYAWSIIASELISNYGFSASQSQIIFGTLIAVFPLTMIISGQLSAIINHRLIGFLSGILFLIGYLLASFSEGNFLIIFLGISILGGIGTGFGYWLGLSLPVQWFPSKKGLITGIVAAGFGLGAVFMSEIAEIILNNGYDVLELIRIVGLVYGLIILVFSNFIYHFKGENDKNVEKISTKHLIHSTTYKKLFMGLFLGTFAGLLIIGSLRMIGGQNDISNHILVLGIALFASANFLGRIFWGFLSDHKGASLIIFFALLFQSLSIFSLNIFLLSDISYLLLSFLIGFGFGGNFVLFAKETAQVYGVKNLGLVYPYVFLGYAIAGITGPISGGMLYDFTDSYTYAITLAAFMSLLGSLLFLIHFAYSKRYSSSRNIDIAAKYIQEGKVVAFPTETVYGLGANALNPSAVTKIFEIKERPSFDPLIVHISNIDQLEKLVVNHDERVYKLAKKFWPGPLTMVLPKSKIVPDIVTSGLPTVGIRMPNNEIALKLITKSACPIAAPSANKFGCISPTTASHVTAKLPNVDYVLEGGKTTVGIESTIIKLTDYGFQILRNGIITQEELEAIVPFDNHSKIEESSAPGMLKSHYSPKKRLLIVDYPIKDIDKSKAGLISFSGKLELGFRKVIRVSEKDDLKDYAVNMFEAMHSFEDDKDIDLIIVEPVIEEGIGKAIMDRLRKAEYNWR